ncbi:ABC transporter ATP-binding protein [Candidatus Woesearchaeota archaeon]|nr:ABC transporter ATP-binding protein [Candidatus Woesearchaeota archaeon]
MKKEILNLEKVNFFYNSKQVLENINFRVFKGDFLGIIGPNGAGKTVLMKNIAGLLKPASGKIYLFGTPIEKFKEWHKIGYVPQKATNFDQTFPSSVEEIVSMGLLSKKRFPKIISGKDREIISEYLKKVDMLSLRKAKIGELSGGQQQRVFIARALVSGPELLILDEPAVGIDKKSQNNFYGLLRDLNKKDGMTIIIITHDISFITKHVNKVACLNQRLLFHGTHEEFCSANMIDNVLGLDKHIVCHDNHDI